MMGNWNKLVSGGVALGLGVEGWVGMKRNNALVKLIRREDAAVMAGRERSDMENF